MRRFRVERTRLQSAQLERLGTELPLPQLRLPYLFTQTIGRDEVDDLATALLDGIDALVPLPTGSAP